MTREGSAHPASPTILAGTPATVLLSGTECSTTEPAATREHRPISILPRILAPAPISTPRLDLGVAVAALLAGAAQGHILQHRNIIPNHRGRADDKTGRVIEENTFADPCRGMNVGLEHFGRTALEIEREILPAGIPERMRQPVRLDRVKPLEIEHRLDQPRAGRIAVDHGGNVGAEGLGDRRIAARWPQNRPAR